MGSTFFARSTRIGGPAPRRKTGIPRAAATRGNDKRPGSHAELLATFVLSRKTFAVYAFHPSPPFTPSALTFDFSQCPSNRGKSSNLSLSRQVGFNKVLPDKSLSDRIQAAKKRKATHGNPRLVAVPRGGEHPGGGGSSGGPAKHCAIDLHCPAIALTTATWYLRYSLPE